MVTYGNLGQFGRLGNQMFQIASTIGLAKGNGLDYGFDFWYCRHTNKDYNFYMKNPLKKLNIDTNKKTINIQETGFEYQKIELKEDFNYVLHGYFQSENYFKNHTEYIKNVFELKPEYIDHIIKKYGDNLNNSCSLHIRRGDYVGLQNFHTLIDYSYYKNAVSKIYGENLKGVNLLIFSDDITWCKNNINFGDANIFYIENNLDIIDMYLMSLCDNNIIANSSFSWWGAWLNKNPSKKVVAPKQWFGPHNSHLITKDLYCEKWIVQ